MRALVDEVRREAEARTLQVEAEAKSSILKLQGDLERLAAGSAARVAAGLALSGGVAEAQASGQLVAERDALKKERDALKAERQRLLSLPNPCGLGIKLAIASQAGLGDASAAGGGGGDGREQGWLEVADLVAGMAALNSGLLRPKDRILAIDGEVFKGHPPPQGQDASAALARASRMLVGKRGSTVKLRVVRGGGGGGHAASQMMEVTLKRGAWGPEHAVVEVERKDMADLGRWPTPIDT